MGNEIIEIGNYSVTYFSVNTLVIGSGAAALNAAVSLRSMGQEDILIATAGWGEGTSNNAGSDKQTYYKLSLSGDMPDSVIDMARDLFNGKCMHGDIALCEAQGSVQAFMKLVNMGVAFPHDKYGSWAGYKTDNDPRARATSAGPYTSGKMFNVLSEEVKRLGIVVLDSHYVVTLLSDNKKERIVGALAINKNEKDTSKAFVLFNATNIILGTGGPGDLYEESAYPPSQSGSTGMAFKAGATGQNLTESQFGIASVGFRWNLSGSYQQVMPRYFSTDSNGNDEKEFLNESFPDYTTLTKAVFLKGYQWPFDPGKVAGWGSSLIDLLVFKERENGRRVFMDFTRNLAWNKDSSFYPLDLDEEVYKYLSRSGALQGTPLERLKALNSPAIALFSDHGIDLSSECLEIAVCAQHCNGGLKGNIWWESDLKHLFPVGEINGSHGVYRPGGSALNSGQVGSYRAAQFIYRKYNEPPAEKKIFFSEVSSGLDKEFARAGCWLSKGEENRCEEILKSIRSGMSDNAGIVRNSIGIRKASDDADHLAEIIDDLCSASSVKELAECFKVSNHVITQRLYLEAIKTYILNGGRSRGSFIVENEETSGEMIPDSGIATPCLCRYDREVEEKIIEIRYSNGKILTNLEKVREIPEQDLWFERVWKDYIEDNLLDC
jgi:succinate dehydrogenase/fumarate reductase flavoprotein subunit